MNSTPCSCDRGRQRGDFAATGAGALAHLVHQAAISERRPSTATLRAEPARNWSLKISSDR